MAQLGQADSIFHLHHEDQNPFGTIAEIGYATAITKDIIFSFLDVATKE
ncbi:hypothetical protein [Sporosarcina cascadiensis]|nr:hypothetical protein [Sporosarcina cascadiensis]